LVDVVLLAAILETVRSADAFETLFNWTWTLYGLLLICVWLGAVTWPQEALRRGIGSLGVQLYGVLPVIHANSVGELGAILATVSFSRLMSVTGGRSSRALYSLLFIASVSTLILSQGRSAILGFLFGTLLVLLLTRRLGLMASICITVPLLLALTSIGSLSWGYFLRGQSPEVFQSLSGRVGWWEFGVQRLLERPLTGYGAYAGGRFAVLAQLGETDVAGLHNAYAEVIVGTSVWGLIPLVLALMGSWWVLIRSLRNPAVMPRDRHLAVEAAAVLGVMTARSFFTTGLIWHPAALPFLLVLGYAEFLRRRYGSNRHRRTGYARIGLSNRSNCRWVPGV
jgi:O-antigen ligase